MPLQTSPPGLREDYESSPLTIAALAAKYDLASADIATLRRAEGWTARPNSIAAMRTYRIAARIAAFDLPTASHVPAAASPAGRAEDPSVVADGSSPTPLTTASAAKSTRTKTRGSPAHRRDLIGRLHDLIDAKIAEIERRVTTGATVSPADSERESKAIGVFIKQLEQLKDVADAEARTKRASDPTGAATDADNARDAERFRQTIVERLDRIRRARTDPPAVGGPVDP